MRVKTLGSGGHPLCERRYWFYIYGSSDCFVSFMIFFVLKNYGGIIQCEGTTVRQTAYLWVITYKNPSSSFFCDIANPFSNSVGVSEILLKKSLIRSILKYNN